MQTHQADYFGAYRTMKRCEMPTACWLSNFTAMADGALSWHNTIRRSWMPFIGLRKIGQNKIVILTGAEGDFIIGVDWNSFGDVSDPGVWSQIHDEGTQVLENIANIRVPVIAAIEGRAHIHSDYALLANVIVAAEGATLQDVGHFAVGVVPGDGIFTTWSYRAGAGRTEAFLLNPRPLPASTAYEWGVVAEVVPNGRALSRARELAALYLKAPEVTRRYTRIHFIQPLKERIVREVGYGLSLEGASSAALMRSRVKSETA
jgi:enoyl-CoA hydratase/carnithine racemase